MEALITAAGLGTRANLPSNMRKEMLPVYSLRNNKIVLRPIIDVVIENLGDNNIKKFYVILDKNDMNTKNYLSSLNYNIEFIFQDIPKGYGKAVLLARDYINNDFILNAGDGIILNQMSLKNIIKKYHEGKKNIITLMKVNNPSHYGVAMIKNNLVTGLEEKPKNPKSNYALSAFYVFTKDIFDFIEGEELTPAINNMVKENIKVYYQKIKRYDWISIGRSENYYKILKRTHDYCKKLSP